MANMQSNNQKSLMVSEVTIDRVLSSYLWNSPTPPNREDMMLSRTYADRTPIKVNALDYMQNGAGRYASAADFKMFENFFNKKDLQPRNQPYSFDEIGYSIYKEKFLQWKDDFYSSEPQKGFNTSISQYSTDTMSPDYVERAFIFGSTQVTVTPADLQKLQFVIHPDGSREIRNLRITPKNDNFDYTGGSSSKNLSSSAEKMMVDKANAVFKAALDPKGFGKTVPIEYTDTQKLPFTNVTDTQFRQMQQQRSRQKMSDTLIEETGIPLITHSASLTLKLLNSPSLYTNDWVHSFKKSLEDIGNMYRKTRDIIDKDPNMMSQNGFVPQYAQAAPQPRLEDLPQRAQDIYHQGKEIFTEFCNHYNIPYRQEDLNNICMAMAAAGYKERMHGVSLIDIDNGEISIAHKSPDLREAVIRMDQAAQTPAEESISRIQQTERQFEQQELERQMAQNQSRGMSL